MNSWQSIDFSETINAYFSAKLLDRDLNLNLPSVILQENSKEQVWSAVSKFGGDDQLKLPLGKRRFLLLNLITTMMMKASKSILKISMSLKMIYLKIKLTKLSLI